MQQPAPLAKRHTALLAADRGNKDGASSKDPCDHDSRLGVRVRLWHLLSGDHCEAPMYDLFARRSLVCRRLAVAASTAAYPPLLRSSVSDCSMAEPEAV